MMEITIITTGGTIDKDYPRPTDGYAFEIGTPAAERILEKIKPNFIYNLITVLKKDSVDITADDRELIFEAVKISNTDKIIITHGTDTMQETAKILSEIPGKTIALVGAARPERFSDSDAAFNLGCAIGALSELETGVYIVMQGRIYPWNKCKRDAETGRFEEI
jgi:L-asparaginase